MSETFPRYALLDGHRPPVHVLSYDGNGFFTVLRRDDSKVFVRRSRLTFIPDKKPGGTK